MPIKTRFKRFVSKFGKIRSNLYRGIEESNLRQFSIPWPTFYKHWQVQAFCGKIPQYTIFSDFNPKVMSKTLEVIYETLCTGGCKSENRSVYTTSVLSPTPLSLHPVLLIIYIT